MTEFGMVMEPVAGFTAKLAARIEQMGFDMLLTPDTQNLSADPYGQLSLAAASTRTLKLATGVTNPVTRVAAVTAGAMATLHQESGGRAVCGLGRGDSSAAHIGQRQATTRELRDYAQAIQNYVSGGDVMINEQVSTMRWIQPGDLPPLPVDIACTGPKTIRMAADVADRVSFAVGSVPEQIEWAMGVLQQRLAETGRERKEISVGAYINLVCDPDESKAIELMRMITGLVAHFAGMKNAPTEHLPDRLKPLADRLKSDYDMKHHAQSAGSHLDLVDDAFVDWFSIAGPAQKCIDRLGVLIDKGLDHVYILGGAPVAFPPGERIASSVAQTEHFAADVLPHFRS